MSNLAPLPLPAPPELRALLRRLALVNVIAADDPAAWRHRFAPLAATGLEVAQVTAVDAALTIVFAAADAAGAGFDRRAAPDESSPTAIVPASVAELLAAADVDLAATTFRCWWSAPTLSWQSDLARRDGRHATDSLRALLFSDPGELADWVAHTHRVRLAPSRLAALFQGGRLSEELVRGLNPACSYQRLFRDHRHLHPLWETPPQ